MGVVRLYHGTSAARLASIGRTGLRPPRPISGTRTRPPPEFFRVYLTADYDYAVAFARAKSGRARAAVITVAVPRAWVRPYGREGWTSGPIPPDRIVGVDRL